MRRGAKGKTARISVIGKGDFKLDGEPHAYSPSGRWALISGNSSTGDYIHRDLFLLDRQEGKLYPIDQENHSPLTAEQVGQIGKVEIKTADAVGESKIRWVHGQDVLLIDSWLVHPGKSAVDLDGDVAPDD